MYFFQVGGNISGLSSEGLLRLSRTIEFLDDRVVINFLYSKVFILRFKCPGIMSTEG